MTGGASLRRTLVSLLVALLVVGGLSAAAIVAFAPPPAFAPVQALSVQQATPAQVRQALRQLDGAPAVATAVTPPGRRRSGFVQLEFDVQADGRPRDIRVVGAVPAGYYEEQAIELTAARRFAPPASDRAGGTGSAIVEFTFTPPGE